jgi:hypothetical protein
MPGLAERVTWGHSHPFPGIQTLLSRSYRSLRFIFLKYVIAIASVTALIYGFTQNLLINIISVILTLAGAYLTFRVSRADMHRYDPWPLKPLNVRKVQISGPMRASGYELIQRSGVPGDALLTSERVNRALLNNASSKLSVDKHNFQAEHQPEVVGEILLDEFRKKKKTKLFNGEKVRLVSEPLMGDDGLLLPVSIQPTHYYDTLTTNDALNLSVRYGLNQNEVFNGQGFYFPDNRVPECRRSQCANQIGMSTIAFTSDHYLIIVGQREGNAFSQRLWAPSGSGSADWKDVRNFNDLQEFVKFAARRELAEECGLTVSDVAWMRVIGYGRLLHRGGLPQFFCLAMLNCSYDRVQKTRPERPFVEFHHPISYDHQRSYREVVSALGRELRDNSYIISSVLWYCVELLSRMSDSDLELAFSKP